MNAKDVKKLIDLQGRLLKLRSQIESDVVKHNKLLMQEIKPLSQEIIHNTIYQVGNTTYKRGRVFCQLDLQEYGLGSKVEALAALRTTNLEDPNVAINLAKNGSTTPPSK